MSESGSGGGGEGGEGGSESESSSSYEEVVVEVNETDCVCPDGHYSLSSSESSDSMDYAAQNVEENEEGGMALFSDGNGVKYVLNFSDSTLMNMWGIFALFLFGNAIFCALCCWKKRKNERLVAEDSMDVANVEVMP